VRLDARVQQLSVLVGANGRVERYIMHDSQDDMKMRTREQLALAGAR